MWVFAVLAIVIALVAFGLGQIWEGAGVPFVIAASTIWATYVSRRGRMMAK
jgi:hypothetical protein